MNGLFSTGGGKAPQSSRIVHLHGQHHCVENEVSFQDHECLHTSAGGRADGPMTEEWKLEAGLGPPS